MIPTTDNPEDTTMQATLTPIADAFHDVPAAQPLACGVTAHLVDPSHIKPGRARRFDRHDRLTRARHVGWHADTIGVDVLTGYVYLCDGDDGPPYSYYALVESSHTDCHYLDPAVYDDAVDAAHAADRMAEWLAELERECDEVRCLAMRARGDLAEANRMRREALGIIRHLRAVPADGGDLAPAFLRLWRQSESGRRRAFAHIDEHRPPRRERPFEPGRVATRAECLSDAWRDGWECDA